MRSRGATWTTYIVLAVISLVAIFPLLWMVSTSLKTTPQVNTITPSLIPHPFVWKNWITAVTYIPFPQYLGNTVFITALSTLGAILVNPMVAYSLARLRWFGRKYLFALTIAVLMLPGTVTLIPVFVEWKMTGLVGTRWPLILGNYLGAPFFIFLLRQFFLGLPVELEDAARVDGLSEYGIYFRIMLPLAIPSVLTVGLFQFMGSWSDFLGPLIYLNNPSTFTISLGMQQFMSLHSVLIQPLMAAGLLTTIPIVILYFFVQKRFIEGITFTGIKG